ncbi:branched-chain alpha-keto acid dehydrogenase e1-alpha subunit [Lentinula edodes]|uniref:2-oxoisovalerate dehydrogenase subunit alpha n=1 Tax=Lentinula edodes TaxID=5353 RepID=A0A1Q3EGZ5_LENED|nr:branched-chain alpha-keto acid dehydrogenase e1-alpha subunit [Lentinula edodes]
MLRRASSTLRPLINRISSLSTRSLGRLPNTQSPIVSKPHFFNSVTGDSNELIPAFRLIDGTGVPLDGAGLPELDEAFARKLYENMQLLPNLDNILYNVQRQGKISFYMTAQPPLPMTMSRPQGKTNACPGVAYALRRSPERSNSVAACFFGEGAASEGDFHAGLLLASTIPSPVVFIARNNGFAISTPSSEQYHGDGIASRGPGYGIDTIRVDGNDVLAVLAAVREARTRCVEQGRAVLVECMSYRVGHHSTSDDSFAYRARSEVEDRKRIDNPLARFRLFMETRGWWDAQAEEELKTRHRADVLKAFKRAETQSRWELGELFTDIYAGEEPWNIKEQRKELGRLLKKYGEDWEPWRRELQKYKNEGRDLIKE